MFVPPTAGGATRKETVWTPTLPLPSSAKMYAFHTPSICGAVNVYVVPFLVNGTSSRPPALLIGWLLRNTWYVIASPCGSLTAAFIVTVLPATMFVELVMDIDWKVGGVFTPAWPAGPPYILAIE